MNRFEAKEFVDRTQRLLRMAAGDPPHTIEDTAYLEDAGIPFDVTKDEDGFTRYALKADARAALKAHCCDLEETARALLFADDRSDFRIITSDPSGPSDDEKVPHFNRLEELAEIEVVDKAQLYEWPDGGLSKIEYQVYVAHGAPYEANGRTVHDYTQSGPEGFVKEGKKIRQYGAASALVARLLEARAAGSF